MKRNIKIWAKITACTAFAVIFVDSAFAISPLPFYLYTYTGQPFSYVGTSPAYGAPVTAISGYFETLGKLAPDTTYSLAPGSSWTPQNPLTDYSFTDGRYTVDSNHYVTSNPLGYGTGSSAPTFTVTTGADGNIVSWDINILTPNAYINTWDVPSWSAPVYSSLYNEGNPSDGVVADPPQPYDAYNSNSPGTWSYVYEPAPEPGCVALSALGMLVLWARRRR